MLFVVIGVAILVMHFAGIGPPANWNYQLTGDLWKFALPFVFALLWWAYADSTGMTKKREMDKLEEKKLERRRKNLEALGIDRDQQKLADAAARARRAAAERIEGGRAAKREQQEKVIRDSVFDTSQQSSSFDDSADAKDKKDKKA